MKKKRASRADMNTAADIVRRTIRSYPQQLTEGFRAGAVVVSRRRAPQNVLLTGMGGSHLAAHIVDSCFPLSVPTVRSRTYDIPAWVDKKTLMVAVSYSGTTEETVAAFRAAHARHATLAAVAAGGTLLKDAKKFHAAALQLPSETNPSGQPRMALPMMFGTLLGFLHSSGLNTVSKRQVADAASHMGHSLKRWLGSNQGPRAAAQRFLQHELLFFGSPRAAGIAHAFQNQCNETAKQTAHWHEIPESNHHLLEGLTYPSVQKRPLAAILIHFPGDSAKIQKRFSVTEAVLKRNGVATVSLTPRTRLPLPAAMELLCWASVFSFELAMGHGEDPTSIPWVNYFKKKLMS